MGIAGGAIAGGIYEGVNDAGNMLINLQLNKIRLQQGQAELRQRQAEHADTVRWQEQTYADQAPVRELIRFQLEEKKKEAARKDEENKQLDTPVNYTDQFKQMGFAPDVIENIIRTSGFDSIKDANGQVPLRAYIELWQQVEKNPFTLEAVFTEPLKRMRVKDEIEGQLVTNWVTNKNKDFFKDLIPGTPEYGQRIQDLLLAKAVPGSDMELYTLARTHAETRGELERNVELYNGFKERIADANKKSETTAIKDFEYWEALPKDKKATFDEKKGGGTFKLMDDPDSLTGKSWVNPVTGVKLSGAPGKQEGLIAAIDKLDGRIIQATTAIKSMPKDDPVLIDMRKERESLVKELEELRKGREKEVKKISPDEAKQMLIDKARRGDKEAQKVLSERGIKY